jgi:hypothetical protein
MKKYTKRGLTNLGLLREVTKLSHPCVPSDCKGAITRD